MFVTERAWKRNNGNWPEPEELPPPTIEYREMLTMEQVLTQWNQEHQADEVLLSEQGAKASTVTASVGAMTMLAIPLLSISMLAIVIPMMAKKEIEVEKPVTIKN